MPSKKKSAGRSLTPSGSSAEVDRFMSSLEHSCKPEIEAVRRIIREADPSIVEGVKWNAPSFRTGEYFATTHLRAKSGVGIIFHLGAKVRQTPSVVIDDPDGLLKWLGKDRAMVSFKDMGEIRARRAAFERIVRQWIQHV